MLSAGLILGPLSQVSQAQSYGVSIDFVFQTSAFVGQDIEILGVVTILARLSDVDTVTVSLSAPDTGTTALEAVFDSSIPAGTEFPFDISHFTLHEGQFTLVVSSTGAGTLLTETYPVPNYALSVEVGPLEGGGGSIFEVETRLDLGEMVVIQSRFDVIYQVAGDTEVETDVVTLLDPDFLRLFDPMPEPDENFGSWFITHTVDVPPGDQLLEVSVIDHSIGSVVLTNTFPLQAEDRIQDLENNVRDLEETTSNLEESLGTLKNETEELQRVGVVTIPASVIATVALFISALTLLIQLGLVKLRRRREGESEARLPPEFER